MQNAVICRRWEETPLPWLASLTPEASARLRECSLATRLFWREMLALIWLVRDRGRAATRSAKPTVADLCGLTELSEDQVLQAIGELALAGLVSVDPDGVLYCPLARAIQSGSRA